MIQMPENVEFILPWSPGMVFLKSFCLVVSSMSRMADMEFFFFLVAA